MVNGWRSSNRAASVLGVMFLLALSAAPGYADDYKVKYTYDTSTNKVLTNVEQNSAFPDARNGQMRGQSTYVKKVQAEQRKVKQARAALKKAAGTAEPSTAGADAAAAGNPASNPRSAKPATAAAGNPASNSRSVKPATGSARTPSGRTVVYHENGNLKIHTVDDNVLPPPRVDYGYAPHSSNTNWAFSTYDASKRQPRLVRYFGWHRDETGREMQGWYEVDLNPLILAASKAAGVDPLLVEIVMCHESNFNPYARSPVGAVGLMQLMPGTASGLGISDVYNVRDNIRGGAQYIAYQLARFNSVPLALAAYNAGPGAVLEYGGVPPYSETQNYVRMIYGEYQEALRKRNAGR